MLFSTRTTIKLFPAKQIHIYHNITWPLKRQTGTEGVGKKMQLPFFQVSDQSFGIFGRKLCLMSTETWQKRKLNEKEY